MDFQILSILLPLLALGFAAISIILLWMWWQSTREEAEELPLEEDFAIPPGDNGDALPEMATSSSFVERVSSFAQNAASKAGEIFGQARRMVAGRTAPSTPPKISSPVVTVDPSAVEVMRVLRDLANGVVLVEIDGRRYRSMDEIENPGIKRRFIGNAIGLAEFAQLDEMDPEAFEQLMEISEPVSAPIATVAPVGEPSSIQEPARVKKLSESDEDPEDEDLRSIAGQIEFLLQQKLIGHPELALQSIHIRDGYDGGIRIEVGDQVYDSVGDVVDDEVREFIQTVIREWEARQ